MEMKQTANRIHPLMAGAAISVMLVSLLGAAVLTGVLPNSQATASPAPSITAPAPAIAPSPPAQQFVPPVMAAAENRDVSTVRKSVVHHRPVQHAQTPSNQQYAQAPAYQQQPPASTQPAPAAQSSPIGIGVGAVVGGLLGSQIGGGNGKTLATIAGAVGGGFLGNEVAKRVP
ncbi:glycine zipper 2TM domain-containing protein [Acidovorax bellezanensis]|uniref:glycine zipper 2TM domain-containing protein n=1 Tax=Acidovorax bellezanensis TaxID=2976702 RepID=UPI0028FC1FBF|nr:glycine zipper 2TM domain-containing protein [Acidovorax sp. Be4]